MHMPLPIPIPGKINRVLAAGVLLFTAIWSAPTPAFGQNFDKWTCANKAVDRNWTDGMNWSTGVAPDSGSDVIIPDATSTCAANVNGSGNAGTLQIMAGGEVIVGPGGTLTINGTSIVNNGQLSLNGTTTGNEAQLLIVGGVTLSGNGRLVMSGGPNNLIGGGGSLSNQSTIEGVGFLGYGGSLTLNNSGIINANGTHSLTVITNNGGLTNSKTLESTNGTLELYGSYMNAGGTIGGTNVKLHNPTISGGTLGAGTIASVSAGTTLIDVTLATGCQFILPSGSVTTLQGTITNSGQITLNETTPGSGAELIINNTVTLTGSGAVTSDGPDNKIDGPGTIVNQQTIQGLGTISVGGFNNQGTVIGNSTTAPMTIVCPGTGVCSSTATVEGAQGGKVVVTCAGNGCTFNDAGGTIINATLNGGVTVSGGTLGGTVEGVNATLGGVTNIGALVINSGDTTIVKGLFINNGTVDMTAVNCNPSCSQATAEIDGNVQFTGTGTWFLHGLNGFTPMITGAAGQSDTLNNGIMIDGAGIIGNGMNVINSSKGGINANSSLPLIISGNSFADQGVLSVAANQGSAASVLTIKGPFKNFNRSTGTLSGGSFNISGTLQFDNANIVNNAAKLTLAGQILDQNNANALLNFANNKATGSLTVLPQTFGTNFTTAGPFSNAGKVTITKGVALVVGASGTNYNQTGGTTTVDGRLAVTAGGLVNITGGTLQGGGALPAGATISGSVSLGNASSPAGIFIIGDSTKKSGLIAIANNYTQLATGVMDAQIGGTTPGTQYSQLNITGTAALTGTLNIAVIKPFKPTVGQTFTILNASTGITGTFSVVNGTVIDATKHFSVSYNPTTVVLTVVSGPAPQGQNLAIQ